jgi:hypothetical protein
LPTSFTSFPPYLGFISGGASVDHGVSLPGLRYESAQWFGHCEQWTASANGVFHLLTSAGGEGVFCVAAIAGLLV